jgi:hypothetical protein
MKEKATNNLNNLYPSHMPHPLDSPLIFTYINSSSKVQSSGLEMD